MEKFSDRIDFLWRTLGYKSARSFDRAIGFSEKQTDAVTGIRQVMPKINYIQSIVKLHPEVSIEWLIMGGNEWKNLPKKTVEDLLLELEALKEERELIKKENQGLKDSVLGLALLQAGHTPNFQLVSNKTPARNRGIVSQLPMFACSVANSTWLSAL